jgi:hypothetical protein
VVNRTWSISWRYLGGPDWLLESDIVSYALWLSACAAVFHLAAPGAIGEMVPPRRWINLGILVAVLMFMSLLLGYVRRSGSGLSGRSITKKGGLSPL